MRFELHNHTDIYPDVSVVGIKAAVATWRFAVLIFISLGLYVDWFTQSPPVSRWWLYVSGLTRRSRCIVSREDYTNL